MPTGTSLDKHQWAELQAHLEEAAAADAAAAAAAAAELQRQGGAASAGAQQAAEAAAALVKTGSFGLPGLQGGARHARGAAHSRTGSIAASLRVGHIPAGSTDAGALESPLARCEIASCTYLATGRLAPLRIPFFVQHKRSLSRHVVLSCLAALGRSWCHALLALTLPVRSCLHPQRHAVGLHCRHAHRSGGRLPAGRAPDRLW